MDASKAPPPPLLCGQITDFVYDFILNALKCSIGSLPKIRDEYTGGHVAQFWPKRHEGTSLKFQGQLLGKVWLFSPGDIKVGGAAVT